MVARSEHATDLTGPDASLRCVVVTPEMTVLETAAQFVALPLYDGELGVAPGRTPLIGRLGFGELRIREAARTIRYYVDGGFVQVAGNEVNVLTNHAIPAESIDADAAREQLAAARAREANSPEKMAIRDRLEHQARAQLRLSRKVARRGASA